MDGLVLGEASVARAFQTSRMPASIALKLLHKEGLISISRDAATWCAAAGGARPSRADWISGRPASNCPHSSPSAPNSQSPQTRSIAQSSNSVATSVVYRRFLLNEAPLAEHFSVSRTIAHEVLTQLERTGIAVEDRNQRWYAGPLTPGDVAHHFEIRWLLEPEALRQAFPHLSQGELIRRRDKVRRARTGRIEPGELERIERDLHQDTLARIAPIRLCSRRSRAANWSSS